MLSKPNLVYEIINQIIVCLKAVYTYVYMEDFETSSFAQPHFKKM